MTDYLAILASIDTISADVLAFNISDEDLSNYFSSNVYSEIVFPWKRDSKLSAELYQAVLPLVVFKPPLDEMVAKDPLAAHATVINRLNSQILRTMPIPVESKQRYDTEIYDTILSYMEYVLLPKWPYLSRDMRAVYVYLLYGALNSVDRRSTGLPIGSSIEGDDKRKQASIIEALLDLDGGNILYPPSEYRLEEMTLPRLATMIESYLSPPPFSLVEGRVERRLLPYT